MTAANLMTPGESDAEMLARDMIDVHGREAASVARENARSAVLAGQATQAKSWIRVLAMVQRQHAGEASLPSDGPGNPSAATSAKG
jgi:hypothetical protein